MAARARVTSARMKAVLVVAPILLGGCPFITTGTREVGHHFGIAFGMSIPVVLKTDPVRAAPEQAPAAEPEPRPNEIRLPGLAVPEEPDLLPPVWVAEVSVCKALASEDGGDRDLVVNEFSLGLGRAWALGRGNIDDGAPRWGLSAGLSLLDSSVDDEVTGKDSSFDVGGYLALGVYELKWGGLIVRYTFAPDCDLGGIDEDMGGLSIMYWWGDPVMRLYSGPVW